MFEQFVRELQRVKLSGLQKRKHVVIFFLNVYNAMVEHGLLRAGEPVERRGLQSFRDGVVYRIGRQDYSLDMLYHCVFRANERPVDAWACRLPRQDPRTQMNTKPDPRAILLRTDAVLPLCGPDAVQSFSLHNCSKQLDDAVVKFCERNVRVDSRGGKVCLPRVFQESWNIYGSSDASVIRWLSSYVPALGDKPSGEWKVVWPDGRT